MPATQPYVATILLTKIFLYDDFCLVQGNDGSTPSPVQIARLLQESSSSPTQKHYV